ncbi:hypothetical protein KSZ_38290 [Dictyobacter formicarum]|uniref:Uncharacterized protein n=1 Tax=Dictyobacter formicarum TaxID=2778368 RepID=A0ABQ3VJP5_9CHLR|nr:hypothetical protein KSZ_38290 [Dictyobacter formicarum]
MEEKDYDYQCTIQTNGIVVSGVQATTVSVPLAYGLAAGASNADDYAYRAQDWTQAADCA